MGLLGKDFREENLVKMYLSSTQALITFLIHNIVQSPKEDRPAFLGRCKSKLLEWIKFHEKHLKANGSNGHYVGDQVKCRSPLVPTFSGYKNLAG
jgi:hypothetical protein